MKRRKYFTIIAPLLFLLAVLSAANATTPSGGWTLAKETPDVKDYFMRIDVDPGQNFPDPYYAPSKVYWAQYINFNKIEGGYLGLQRVGDTKTAIVSIWGGITAKPGALPVAYCFEFSPCTSIKGDYDWKVGHKYRFRVERSPRTASSQSGDWWQVSLADLTMGTVAILGEIMTNVSGGLTRSNDVFLEYFQGPFQCNTLRHSKATDAQIRGNYGQDTALAASNGDSYDAPNVCPVQYILPEMQQKDYDSSSSISNGTITLLGNQYRGIHKWGKYNGKANPGMMFAANPDEAQPYIFKARHDGVYGAFPQNGSDNSDWRSVGRGYPIINDLYFRNQKVYDWEERNNAYVLIGDYFIYDNPSSGDTEYFKKLRKNPSYFPTAKTSNDDWEYVGRYSKSTDVLSSALPVHNWNDNNQIGNRGWLYYNPDTRMYFILKMTGAYWTFPTGAEDNIWWQFAGYHP